MGDSLYEGPDFLNLDLRREVDEQAARDREQLQKLDRRTAEKAIESLPVIYKLLQRRSKALLNLLEKFPVSKIGWLREWAQSLPFGLYTEPSVYRYDDHNRLIELITTELHLSLQVVIDAICADPLAKRSTEFVRQLSRHARSLDKYLRLIGADYHKHKPFILPSINVSKIDDTEEHYLDYFHPENFNARARISSMGPDGVLPKSVSIYTSIKSRILQIDFLEALVATLWSLKNLGVQVAKFDLFNPEHLSWLLETLCQHPDILDRFKGVSAPEPYARFYYLVDFWKRFLLAFTISARDNILDEGKIENEPNYLKSPFPRALTGQRLLDCGAFAVLTMFVFSRVTKKFGMKNRFIRMPFHAGVIITKPQGWDEDEKLLLVAHNESLLTFVDKIDASPWFEKSDECPHSVSGGLEYFLGEHAIAAFYGSALVDSPFDLLEVAMGAKPVDDIWAKFLELSLNINLFVEAISPPSLSKLPQRYLKLTAKLKDRRLDPVTEFWNLQAPKLWKEFTRIPDADGKHGPISERSYKDQLRKSYRKNILDTYDTIEEFADRQIAGPIRARMGDQSNERSLLTKDAKLSCKRRVGRAPPISGWSKDIYEYMTVTLQQSGDALKESVPPFVKQPLEPIE